MNQENPSFFDKFNKFLKNITTTIVLVGSFVAAVYIFVEENPNKIRHIFNAIENIYSEIFQKHPVEAAASTPAPAPAPAPARSNQPSENQKPLSLSPDQEKCDLIRSPNNTSWKENFILTVSDNTFHVFISSLPKGKNEEDAKRHAKDMERKYPGIYFEVMETMGPDGNDRWAIVVAQGIKNINLAREICTYTVKCNIKRDAYIYEQNGRNMGCFAQ